MLFSHLGAKGILKDSNDAVLAQGKLSFVNNTIQHFRSSKSYPSSILSREASILRFADGESSAACGSVGNKDKCSDKPCQPFRFTAGKVYFNSSHGSQVRKIHTFPGEIRKKR